MFWTPFKIIFLVSLVAMETLRAPHRKRNRAQRHSQEIVDNRVNRLEVILMTLSFFGLYVLPLIYVFSNWLSFADYRLPDAFGWLGAVLALAAVVLLWRAHADLGRNWSPSVEISQNQKLITSGVYSVIRHPIYAAMLLFTLAQALLLHNWIAGLSGLAIYLPIMIQRVPREEAMMVSAFGEEYRTYMHKTGGVIPRLFR